MILQTVFSELLSVIYHNLSMYISIVNSSTTILYYKYETKVGHYTVTAGNIRLI